MTDKIRVLSGIRASHSSLHIGNLLGAIKGMITLQNDPKYETFYMVADLHGITTPFVPEELKKNRLSVAMDFLAAGIDPKKSVLFLQSEVPEHAEFAYYLSQAISPYELLHLPSYKEKKKQYAGYPSTMALLSYPILMAADILLYKAKKVPIAKDQLPHLEITRKIARKMNDKYNLKLPEPEQFSAIDEKMMVPSVLGKGNKMSKSKEGSAIFLSDSFEDVKRKVLGIPTDIGKGDTVPKKGDVAYDFFVFIELILGPERRKEVERDYLSMGVKYSTLKVDLAEAIYKKIKPIQEKRAELEKNPEQVEKILADGAIKAREVAKQTLFEVREAMGLPSMLPQSK